MRGQKQLIISTTLLISALAGYAFYTYGRPTWVPVAQAISGKRSVADVSKTIGPAARERLKARFEAAGASYPPKKVTLLAIKDQARLELWAGPPSTAVKIETYPIQRLSGVAGPKLREGDRQVPEGIYRVSYLNPNSSYHLSMKLNYPNAFDLKHAKAEGRTEPGTNIFIHGKAVSIGCLAMGDPAIEELFILAVDSGRSAFKVVIAPSDPRLAPLNNSSDKAWVTELYKQISAAYLPFK